MTFHELSALLRYENGALYWKVSRGMTLRAGARAGSLNRDGYLSVNCMGRTMAAHRIVWLLCMGEWPRTTLDHINGIRTDNRIENLRPCTTAQNAANRAARHGTYKGVAFHKQARKFQAQMGGKYLGLFTEEDAAARAYDAEAVRRFGEFARLNFPAAGSAA